MARKSANRQLLTTELVDSVKPNEDGTQKRIYDSKVRSLLLVINRAGTKTFFVYRSWKNKPFQKEICNWNDGISLVDIRKLAGKINYQLENGENPNEKSREERESITLKDVFEYYKLAQIDKGMKSVVYTEQKFNKYLSNLHNKPLMSITANDISAITRKLASKGYKTTANRVRTIVATLYNHAIKKLEYPHNNPCTMVEIYPEQKREIFLQKDELARLIDSAEKEGEPYASVFKLLIFTGLRVENVLGLKIEWVDWENSTLTIPAEHHKTKSQLVIPLAPNALKVLSERRKTAKKKQEYFFPRFGKRPGKRKHMAYPKWAWLRILDRAGLKDITIHQIRHSFASLLIANGCPLIIVSKLLGHKSCRTTERYAHLLMADLRKEVGQAIQIFDQT